MRYRVDFYDMIDGWGGTAFHGEFDDYEDAKRVCIKNQAELDDGNKSAGEHWGVIDMELGMEVFCTDEP